MLAAGRHAAARDDAAAQRLSLLHNEEEEEDEEKLDLKTRELLAEADADAAAGAGAEVGQGSSVAVQRRSRQPTAVSSTDEIESPLGAADASANSAAASSSSSSSSSSASSSSSGSSDSDSSSSDSDEGAAPATSSSAAAAAAASVSSPQEPAGGRRTSGVTLAFVRRKLFTKEDPIHLHKTLGVLSLLSFIYRYLVVLPSTGSLGFTELSWFNVATVCVHAGLSCSGMIFRVPAKRIRRLPTTIWEEYRQHAALFSLRCAAMFALAHAFPGAGAAARFTACMSWHWVADRVTEKWGTPGETSVRGRDNTTRQSVYWIRRFFAFYQILAVASQLIPSPWAADLAWNTFIAIQSSAFLMTLKRKNLIVWQTHAIGYGICLLFSTAYILAATQPNFLFLAGVVTAFLVRTQLGINKFIIWAVFAAAATTPEDWFTLFEAAR